MSTMFLRLHQVDMAPSAMGLYAWYCKYSISKADIQSLIEQLSPIHDDHDRMELIRDFLDRKVFRRFQEPPYTVDIQAPLRPHYRGEAAHIPTISTSLLERLARDPQRLASVASALSKSVPNFASPIYIGTAVNLKRRLNQHAKLLATIEPLTSPYSADLEYIADHSFAQDAISRKLDPNDLWVYVQAFDFPTDLRFDLENLLNRINFPLCGRN